SQQIIENACAAAQLMHGASDIILRPFIITIRSCHDDTFSDVQDINVIALQPRDMGYL
ncbi:hypothetical protein ACJX0J_013297, partial [Zea mays]